MKKWFRLRIMKWLSTPVVAYKLVKVSVRAGQVPEAVTITVFNMPSSGRHASVVVHYQTDCDYFSYEADELDLALSEFLFVKELVDARSYTLTTVTSVA